MDPGRNPKFNVLYTRVWSSSFMAYCQVTGDRNVLQTLEKLLLKSMLVRGGMAGCKILQITRYNSHSVNE